MKRVQFFSDSGENQRAPG